jgi:hypothetical protein
MTAATSAPKPTSRVLSLRFVPLDSVAKQCDAPHRGTAGQVDDRRFEFDGRTRSVVLACGAKGAPALAKLPDGFDAVLVNSDEPLDIHMWVVGREEDCIELRAAVNDFQTARERLLGLLSPE